MEMSMLLIDEIHIEDERWELQKSGLSWPEIRSILDSKYRENSKKRLFRCRCCDSTTFMVLNEKKACFFKHDSKEECAGLRNYKRYTDDLKKNESNLKHRAGKSIIRDQLKANLSRFGAIVKDGYLYRKEIKYVTDLIVEWDNGDIWSFDYVTGTRNHTYQQHLEKKQKAYQSYGFKAYFLFDESQLSFIKEHNTLSLSLGERGSLSFMDNDPKWEEALAKMVYRFGESSLLTDDRLTFSNMKVSRLLYVTDEITGILYKLSQLEVKPVARMEIPDRFYYIVGQERHLSILDLFTFTDDRKFAWEQSYMDSPELARMTAKAEERYKTLQRLREEQERERDERQQRAAATSRMLTKSLKESGSIQAPLASSQTEHYEYVIEQMKNSPILESSPRFSDRIKECEEDLAEFRKTGSMPPRIITLINMMKAALRI